MSETLNKLIGTNMSFFKQNTSGIFNGNEYCDYPRIALLSDGNNAIYGITENGRVNSSLVVYATHDTTNEVREVTLTWISRYTDNEHCLTYAESWYLPEYESFLQSDCVIRDWNIPILTKKIDLLIKGKKIKTITQNQNNIFSECMNITDEQIDDMVNHGDGQWTISLYKQ